MLKHDLKRELKHLYSASTKAVEVVDVPPMNYLMIDGSGDPNTAQEYQDAVSALYNVAYTLKFALKKREGLDYPVMALEGLWWVEDLSKLDMDDKSNWLWTMMIVQPDFVTQAVFESAVDDLRKKKNPPLLDRVRLESYHEGLSAQILHIGPYAAEQPTIERLYAYMSEHGYVHNGKHHEIYLGDPRRSTPEKLRTIIRQPIASKPI
jgi:hypothetical protein